MKNGFFQIQQTSKIVVEPFAAFCRGGGGVRTGDILRRGAARRLPGERPDPGAGRKLRLPCLGVLRGDAPGAGADAPRKWVCLTFDDGPSKTTPDVLSALNRAGVKATFFVVATGNNDKYLPLISEAAAAGHQIALHSASHEYSDIYQSADAYWKDIDLLKERLTPYVRADGLRYLRFPGGSTNTVSRRYGGRGLMQQLKEEVTAKGYAYVDWNVCAEDAVGGKPSAGTIFRNIVRETGEQTQCIVLMHDSATTRTTAEALPDIIQWYKDNGFTFLTVEQAVPLPTTIAKSPGRGPAETADFPGLWWL